MKLVCLLGSPRPKGNSTAIARQAPAIGCLCAETVFAAICLYLLFMAYIVPGLVAWDRRHHAAVGIWTLTLLLGWTGIGWLAALLWAVIGMLLGAYAQGRWWPLVRD